MNVGGFLFLSLLGATALVVRGQRPGAEPAERRGLLLLGILLPVAGLLLPFLPWRTAAAGLALAGMAGLAAAAFHDRSGG